MLILISIGISSYGDYGISFDEKVETEMVLWHLQSIGSDGDFREIPFDLEFYGTFFNGISMLFFMALESLRTSFPPVASLLDQGLRSESIYLNKHLFTFLFSSLTYLGVSLCIKDLLNWKLAPVGILFLALTPRFWGHSFFNPKDIPFAALFILVSYFGAQWIAQIVKSIYSENLNIKQDYKLLFGAVFFGVIAGLLSCIRIGGFIVIGFSLITIMGVLTVNRLQSNDDLSKIPQEPLASFLNPKTFISLIVLGFVVVITWFVIVIGLTPAAWSNPLGWLLAAINYMANHSWPGRTLTLGMALPAQPPWFYLPVWFGVTVPLMTLTFSVIGLWESWTQFTSQQIKNQSLIAWLTLQCFVFPIIVVLKKTTIYDAERQFLFVIPALIVFAVIGFNKLLNVINSRAWYVACITLTIVVYSTVMADMKSLHPYEQIYFNSLARIVGIDRKFETDYWITSGREAMYWIGEQAETTKSVYAVFPHIVEPSAKPGVSIQGVPPTILDFPATDYPRPFYFLAYPRVMLYSSSGEAVTPHPHDLLPGCENVFQVERTIGTETIPLTQVKKCE